MKYIINEPFCRNGKADSINGLDADYKPPYLDLFGDEIG
jgi:hypothetical protein